MWKRQINESEYHPNIKGGIDCQDRFLRSVLKIFINSSIAQPRAAGYLLQVSEGWIIRRCALSNHPCGAQVNHLMNSRVVGAATWAEKGKGGRTIVNS